MKEWIMKHPILTFLLMDGVITGLFNTIRTFAPNQEYIPKEEATDTDSDASIEENKEESK